VQVETQNSKFKVQKQITKRQIKKIHTLVSKLGMSDEEYRLLLSDYWVDTSKKLSYAEAEDLIQRLEREAIKKGVWSRYSLRGKMRYEDLGERPGMATPAQLRMIEAMWKEVSHIHNIERRQRALRRFIFRIVGVSDMRFLEVLHVKKVIKALNEMKRQKPFTRIGRWG
jgi:hypothetical protein